MHRIQARKRVIRSATAAGAAVVAALALASAPAAQAARPASNPLFTQTNLVSDQAGMAQATDPNLVNPWGLSYAPGGPLWVSNNGTDTSTLYSGGVNGGAVQVLPLVVATPGGAPTGQVYNDTSGFTVPGTGGRALFIFAGEHGDITAWNSAAGSTAVAVAHASNSVYKGLALAHNASGTLLLATNFHKGRVDVYDSTFTRVSGSGLFTDPNLPAGYAPFGIATVGSQILVSYAKQDAARGDDKPGLGHGFVDAYTTAGTFVSRLISQGDLNSPWALTLAPASFGTFAHDLLVGNFGDGRIHAYNPSTGAELGTLKGTNGHALVIDGLWGLLPGNASAGGTNALWFSAGPNGESHGLLGLLTAS